MIDLALLAAGGQVLKDTHAAFKKVQEIKQNSELCDLLEKILDLRQTVLDAKHEIVDLRTELAELRKRKETDDRLDFDSKIGVFFMREDVSRLAYCTKCWKKDGNLVPMTASDRGYICSVCDSNYKNPDYVYPSC
ncbi:hypothetical protein H4684_000490 [Desulfomicrobium macestii]|uniref:Uncharacterized protein n=1 Tax=Desulfomicrobium macestii TaxID=90731 RepID=A0ABR9GZI3_9BACT|nr:hypothetical protein [Desulfomicrobium macestii]MBE1423866.1 hypothetical protein [Desulfomicrobium macestii]